MPEPRLPDDIRAIADLIPAWPRGLGELRLRLSQLPALSPNALPGITSAEFPEDAGAVATSGTGTATGSSSGSLTTGESPGSIPGSSITPNTLPPAQLAANLRPPKVVSSLPSLPDAAYPSGSIVYNTGDAPPRLYRTDDAATWQPFITGDDIVARSITAGQIEVGAIGADELAASIVLASVLKTAESGRRVEISTAGIDLVDSTGKVLARLPTDGSAVKVVGEVEASRLVSTTLMELRTAGRISPSAVIEVLDQLRPPAAAPVLSLAAQSTVQAGTAPGSPDAHYGLAWDATAGTWFTCWPSSTSGYFVIAEVNATTGAVIRSRDGLTALYDKGTVWGVAVSATYVHLLVRYTSGSSQFVELRRFLRSDLSVSARTDISAQFAGTPAQGSLCWDGSELKVIAKPSVGNTRIVRYDESHASLGTLTMTGNPDATSSAQGACAGEGALWVRLAASGQVRSFNLTTGAYIADREFDQDGRGSNGIGHDGSNFAGRNGTRLISKFTNWDWTSGGAVYWLGYSWYDSAGTPHETPTGPHSSITMKRRLALSVSTDAIPTGGADDPNAVRIYMVLNATEMAAGSYKLQATDSLLSRLLTSYNAAGAADPTTSNFPTTTPGEIRAAGGGWVLKGDGTKTGFSAAASNAWDGVVNGAFGDGDPGKLLRMAYAGTVAATPTNIGTSVARIAYFRLPAGITVNKIRFLGVGATTNVYRCAIYNGDTLARLTAELAFTTAANTWGAAGSSLGLALTAGQLYFIAVSVNAVGTTAGCLCIMPTFAATTGLIAVLPKSWPGSLDIDSGYVREAFAQFAVTTGALPATAPTIAVPAAWTGGFPMFMLDSSNA